MGNFGSRRFDVQCTKWIINSFMIGVLMLIVNGCTDHQSTHNLSTSKIKIDLKPGVLATQAFEIIARDGIVPAIQMNINWPDHHSTWEIQEGSASEQKLDVINRERAMLEFLRSHFNPNDERESVVYHQLSDDLEQLTVDEDVPITSIVISSEEVNPDLGQHPLVLSMSPLFLHKHEKTFQQTSSALTDYSPDPAYVPQGGTSTVSSAGTLQKFWLDRESMLQWASPRDGIEIDTVMSPRDRVTCNTNGWGSNLPQSYVDTEAADGGNYRTCSVGGISAITLTVGTLYWTWHPFGSFNVQSNPSILINFQPSTWCPWVVNANQCNLSRAWCMCSRNDKPIKHLISYNYNEAPNREVGWSKQH